MSSKKNILSEAIADAKAIKEAALANAKAAIAETFTPTLKSLISAELHEELEEDLNKTNEVAEEDLDEAKDDKKDDDKEDLDESNDLDALLKELEAGDDDDTEDELDEKFADKVTSDTDPLDEKGDEEEGGEKDSKDADYELYLQLKKKFEPKPKDEAEAPESGEGTGEEGSEDTFDIESIIRELENESKDDNAEEEGGDGKEELDEKFAKKDDNASKDDSDKITPMDEKVEEELKEIEAIRKELSETNLLNAKLVYFGKVVKEHDALTKTDKVSFLKQFDKATTVKEAKLIYGTITESLKSNKKKKTTNIKENLGFSSKASGVAPKKPAAEGALLNEETVNRFKFLAGLTD